ncbi:hypothetical protein [Cytobacillus oceanisediminis]|uniref:YVTN family beta-propeller protein n=1 Tax=Cytobacillus oceanisediminis 2691 TaxID=1196031 RepID=A0A160MET5_9BACI|nr:hypothetical protein [Cytobacillus oceanisediminis]AND41068.1 hypothetical protein A361_18570 [Cytobacillus oceanisediminis 2691]
MSKNKYWFFLLLIIAAFLTSCSEKRQPAIPEDITFAATVNIKDMTISYVDLAKKEMAAEWIMEKPYTGALILPDNDSILLYGKQLETADQYSLKEGKLIDSWETGEGIVNGILLDTNEIAFADQNLNKIRFFNLNGEEEKQVETERDPLTLLESSAEKKLFVLSFNHEKLGIIDLESKAKSGEFTIHPSAAGAWLNEKSGEIWIGGHGEGVEIEQNIHVYNTETGELKKRIKAASMPINFLGQENHVYVLSHGSNMLYKINESGEETASVSVAANPFEMAFAKDILLVAGYDSNDLHILEPKNLKTIKNIKVGEGPFKIVIRESVK